MYHPVTLYYPQSKINWFIKICTVSVTLGNPSSKVTGSGVLDKLILQMGVLSVRAYQLYNFGSKSDAAVGIHQRNPKT